MTDSIRRKQRGGATEEELEKLRNLPQKNPSDRTELSDLPRWARMALVQFEIMGMTWDEAAKAGPNLLPCWQECQGCCS